MVHHFDHRFGTYEGQTEAQANQGKLPELSDDEHAQPDLFSLPRYWVPKKTVDDALSRTDKFLDDAFLAHLPQVRIVHGMGTGALRNAISDLLRTHPHVVRFESAPQSEGGRGVTIATLRD